MENNRQPDCSAISHSAMENRLEILILATCSRLCSSDVELESGPHAASQTGVRGQVDTGMVGMGPQRRVV